MTSRLSWLLHTFRSSVNSHLDPSTNNRDKKGPEKEEKWGPKFRSVVLPATTSFDAAVSTIKYFICL